MRNELVHHLIERFDLWTSDGCAAAIGHLGGCYERIDRQHRDLADWAKHISEARAMMASFAQTDVFYDMVVSGIAPDGSFEMPATGTVSVLRQAASRLSEQGWARLDQAVAWIESEEPGQIPGKYGCRTRPQVLAESRLFDLEYRVGEDRRKVAWFRERFRGG